MRVKLGISEGFFVAALLRMTTGFSYGARSRERRESTIPEGISLEKFSQEARTL
jgi:hypothetical protein